MRITSVLLALVVIVAAGATTSTQQRRGRGGSVTIAVVLTDPAGTPIADALVTLQGATERTGRTERGRIAFENLPAGNYRLRFEHDGYITLERELSARGAAPVDVKATLNPAPPPTPVPCAEPPPKQAAGAPVVAPMSIDLPDFIDRNRLGRDPSKTSSVACTPGGLASVIQVKDPLAEQTHADADEFIYVIAGTGTVRIGDRVESLQSGVLALVPRTMSHTISAAGRNPLYILSIRAGEKCGVAAASSPKG